MSQVTAAAKVQEYRGGGKQEDDDPPDPPDETPETPLDEPPVIPVQDPPPQPDAQGPYVVVGSDGPRSHRAALGWSLLSAPKGDARGHRPSVDR